MKKIRARLRGVFIETAQKRLRRAVKLLGSEFPECAKAIASEFHALAGEASLLGFDELSETARSGEVSARRWLADQALSAKAECARTLRALTRSVNEMEEGSEGERD